MKTNLLALIFLMLSFSLFAQEQKQIKKSIIQDFSVQLGFVIQGNTRGTIADFKSLAPQSVLLNNDLSGYNETHRYSTPVNALFSVALGLRLGNREITSHRITPSLRLGFDYYAGKNLKLSLSKVEQKPYDTLTSSQTGQQFFIDSVNTKEYFMNYFVEQARFDASLIFRTDPRLRCSLYAGIGLNIGFSYNSKTTIGFDEHTAEDHYFYGYSGSSYYYYNSDRKQEHIKNENNISFCAYIPLGFDFRISKRNEFFKKIHIFYELRPGININSIKEIGTSTNSFVQNGFGIRVNWD